MTWSGHDWRLAVEGAQQGYYAWADGLNPFGDFYAEMGRYDPNSVDMMASRLLGSASQTLVLTMVGAGVASRVVHASGQSFGSWKLGEQILVSQNIGQHLMRLHAADTLGTSAGAAFGYGLDAISLASKISLGLESITFVDTLLGEEPKP